MSGEKRPWTPEEEDQINTLLTKKLGPEYVSRRQAGGGVSVPYIEAWKAIGLANDIFKFNGWSSEVRSINVEYIDCQEGKYSIGVSALVRVTLKDGSFREDCGFGSIENVRHKSMGLDKCRKEACTDALKRTLRLFGNALGNCLYDTVYIRKVGGVSRAMLPFDEANLVRPGKLFEERDIQALSNAEKSAESKNKFATGTSASTSSSTDAPAITSNSAIKTTTNTGPTERIRPPPSNAPVDHFEPDVHAEGISALIFSQDLLSDEIQTADLEDYPGVGDQSETNVILGSMSVIEMTETSEPENPQTASASVPKNTETETDQSKDSTTSIVTPSPAPAPAAPNALVGFVSARGAESLLNNKPLASEDLFDPNFQSPNIARTLDHNKSVPVQRPKSANANTTTPVAPRMTRSMGTASTATPVRTPLSEKTPNENVQRPEKRAKLV